MAYEITLHDSVQTWVSPSPNTPLSEKIIESSFDVTTLDLNLYVDLMNTKKMWTIRWGYMSAEDYAVLRSFYDRQYSLLEFPDVTIPDLGVSGVVTRMTLSDQDITDESGLVENVTVTLQETVQATPNYFVS